jgi:outer membrane lipoprotein-sorting protein
MLKKIVLSLFLLLHMIFKPTYGQRAVKNSTADDLLTKAIHVFSVVNDFTVTIDAEIQMERVQIPKMNAVMYFKKPDKIHFSSQGFLAVPREGIVMNPSFFRERYTVASMVLDTVHENNQFKIMLNAKENKSRLRDVAIWINPANWTVSKMETIPYEGRVLTVSFSYACIEEKYWLLSKMVAGFTSESEKPAADSPSSPDQQFESMQRSIPRTGTVTVLYSNYKVNTGLTDELFEKKETK